MKTQLETFLDAEVLDEEDYGEKEFDDESFERLVVIPETPLEYRVCFALLAANLGYDPFDMNTFAPDEMGRWRPKYAEPGQFQGAFLILDDPGDFHNEDNRTVEVCYEFCKEGRWVVSSKPVNEESYGLGVAQLEFYVRHVGDDDLMGLDLDIP